MDNYYDSIAMGYEELHKYEQLRKIWIVKKYLKVKPTDKLLDVGCGSGLTSDFPCIVTGLDPSSKLLEKARKMKIKTVQGRAEAIPFPDNTFDIVISITAIQNFSDIKKGLQEIRRVGKDRFALSFLKKSMKAAQIESYIRQMFSIDTRIEEDMDIIFIAKTIPSEGA